MKHLIVALLATASLAGCQTPEQVSAQNISDDSAKCHSYGFPSGSSQFAQCRMALDRDRGAAQQQASRDQFRAGMAMLAASQPRPSPTVTCTTWYNTTTCR